MKHNRRQFIRQTGCALSMLALATQARHFGMVSAMAQTLNDADGVTAAPSDYRALVCVYLQGGNDGNNVVIPNHNGTATISGYSAYSAGRASSTLAIAQDKLLPISVPRVDAVGGASLPYGFHPSFGDMTGQTVSGGNPNKGIHDLYNTGKMAVVTNVGNLVQPLTRAQYQSNNAVYRKPYQLFSHSDQTAQQQSARADRRAYSGWGGRIADARTSGDNPGALVPMITSISGTQLFTNGQGTQPLAIGTATNNNSLANVLQLGGFGTDAASTARRTALTDLRGIDLNNDVVRAASHITDQAFAASTALSTNPQDVTFAFPNTGLGQQLRQVARIIKKRSDLAVNRQIFFVQIGGFDTHNNQLATQRDLLLQLSQAMRAFYEEMTVQGMQNSVTAFTLSDFGRTFIPAGTGAIVGSDHAWGNHALVMGGAVKGGDFYGVNTSNGTPFPTLQAAGIDDTDSGSGARGRWIPTTAVDQYAATLANWFGVADDGTANSQLSAIFPNLSNFQLRNLGFLNS